MLFISNFIVFMKLVVQVQSEYNGTYPLSSDYQSGQILIDYDALVTMETNNHGNQHS